MSGLADHVERVREFWRRILRGRDWGFGVGASPCCQTLMYLTVKTCRCGKTDNWAAVKYTRILEVNAAAVKAIGSLQPPI